MRQAFTVAAGLLFVARGLCADEPVGSSVRYSREIVRIFERKCVPCHVSGGPALPLATFHEVLPWTRSIREEILERRMPPWSAAHGVKPLANDVSLSTREIAIIVSWADGGAPRGDPADLPEAKPRPRWPAGEPALKLSAPAQSVVADGRLQVRRVRLPTGLRAERWLRGFDLAPGGRSIVRSAFLFLETPGGSEQWLGGWTPWYAMTSSPGGVAYRLPAGAVLTLEIHYLSSGPEAATDRSEIGLYFVPARPTSQAQDLAIAASRGAQGRLRGETTLAADSTLWALRPRLEGAGGPVSGSIEVAAAQPDGAIEPLLWVKDLLPDWQTPYVLREPARLPRGTRLIVTAYPAAASAADASARVDVALFPGGAAGVPAADGRVSEPAPPPRR